MSGNSQDRKKFKKAVERKAQEWLEGLLKRERSTATELLLAGLGFVGEYLAMRFEHTLLTVLGAVLLWLAFYDYTKGRERFLWMKTP